MYHLHQTDNLEEAALQHATLLEADPDGPSTIVIVQSAHMQRWLSLVLSRRRGIWFQPHFATPDSGLRTILGDMVQDNGKQPPRTLFMDDLKYLSFRTLGSAAQAKDFSTRYPVLSQLLSQSESNNRARVGQNFSRQRLYELADTIAGMFFGYSQIFWSARAGGIADSHIFRLWESGVSLFSGTNLAETEEWQRRLYLEMFPADRSFDILGYQTYRAAAERWQYRGPYKRIVLFGSAFLSSQAFGLFRMLSDSEIEIHHILMTPGPALEASPEKVAELALVRPLDDWANLLAPFLEDASTAALDRTVSLNRGNIPLPPEFKLFSCTTPLREVQALKQNLMVLIAQHRNTANPLLLQDIAIMAPDIRRYRPWLEAYFPSFNAHGQPNPDHLALNIVDLDFGTGSSVKAALDRLLSLGSSRLEHSTILELLDNPAIRLAIGVDDDGVESFTRWSSAYEIRWGLNSEHRRRMEAGSSWSNTWDKGLRRLFEDLALGQIDAGGSEIEAIGAIAAYLHGVIETVQGWESSQTDLATWVRELRAFLDLRLEAPDETEERILEQIRSAAGNLLQIARDLGDLQTQKDELDWAGFRILFQDQIAHLSGGKGQHQIDGITCSSLRPYRAIPFRLIALLGMNEGELPRRDVLVSFDLSRHAERCRGLITNRVQDNYAWLETLVSAREYLWVFYAGRDAASGEQLSCAPMVEETRTIAQAGVIEERISSFDTDYFRSTAPSSGLISSSSEDLVLAQILGEAAHRNSGQRAQTDFIEPFFHAVRGDDIEFLKGKDGLGIDVNLKQLFDFTLNPIQSYVQNRLGLRLKRTEQDDVESFDLSPWIPHQAIRELAETAGDSPADVLGIANEVIARALERDSLFDGPMADRAQHELGRALALVEHDLVDLLSPGSTIPEKGAQDFEIEREIRLDLPNRLLPDSATTYLSETIKVRLRGSLDSIWHLGHDPVWVVIGTKHAASASDISNHYFLNFAIVRAICDALGHKRPERFIYISLKQGKKKAGQILDLSVLDLGDFELLLDALLTSWLLNLVQPLPLYAGFTSKLLGPLATAQTAKTNEQGDFTAFVRERWNEIWDATMQKESYGDHSYGIPETAADCPSWQLLNPVGYEAPDFHDWYIPVLEKVWLPLWHRRQSFIRGYKPSAKEGKEK